MAQKEAEREKRDAERLQLREEKARKAAEDKAEKEKVRDQVELRKANQRFHTAIAKVQGQAEKKRKADEKK
jgi:hypothetical protein